jgi:hypothetical protein
MRTPGCQPPRCTARQPDCRWPARAVASRYEGEWRHTPPRSKEGRAPSAGGVRLAVTGGVMASQKDCIEFALQCERLARISHTTEDWAPGKPILSDAGPAPRVFVAPKALYVGNFLDLRGSVSCARNDRAGAARVMPGRRGRWQRLRAGLRRVPNLARPGRPMSWRS